MFMYLLAPFIEQNLKKNLKQIESYEDAPFLGKNDQITPNQFYFRKTINIISMSFFAPFIVQNCNTILTADLQL